jgi:uncharacterized protein YbjT (DUF2867 family)
MFFFSFFKENSMYIIAGVTGHVGFAAAEFMLSLGQRIKVIVRDKNQGAKWAKQGAEVAVGNLEDIAFLTGALKGAKGAFLLLPPNFASVEILADQKKLSATMASAVKAAQVPHVVALSSNGADQAEGTGPIKGLYHFENALRASGAKVTAIRAGFFMENIGQAISAAKAAGIYPNLLPSQDIMMPMIATKDIGQLVAECLIAGPKTEIVDLTGPAYTVKQLSEKVSKALNKQIPIVDIPQSGWLDALINGGVPKQWAEQYVEMYQGMLSGKITPKGDRTVIGKTQIDTVITALVG